MLINDPAELTDNAKLATYTVGRPTHHLQKKEMRFYSVTTIGRRVALIYGFAQTFSAYANAARHDDQPDDRRTTAFPAGRVHIRNVLGAALKDTVTHLLAFVSYLLSQDLPWRYLLA